MLLLEQLLDQFAVEAGILVVGLDFQHPAIGRDRFLEAVGARQGIAQVVLGAPVVLALEHLRRGLVLTAPVQRSTAPLRVFEEFGCAGGVALL